MKKIVIILAILFIFSYQQFSLAEDRKLQELSGILQKNSKSLSPYYLKLDGMTGNFSLRGEILKKFKEGDRLYVKGHIITELHNPKSDNSPQQQPLHWEIFMKVIEARKINTLLDLSPKITTQSNVLDKKIIESWGSQKDFFIQKNFEIINWQEAKDILLKKKINGGKQYHTGWLTIYTANNKNYLVKQPQIDAIFQFIKEAGKKLEGFATE